MLIINFNLELIKLLLVHTILCTYNVAFVGEFIAGLVKYFLSPFAETGACVALSFKIHFSGHVKIRLFHN